MSDFEPTPPGDAVDPDEIPETDLTDFESQVVEQFNAREAQSSAASDEVSADASPSPGSEAGAAPAKSGAALDFVEPVDDQVEGETYAEPDQNLWAGYDEQNQQMARGVYDWYTKLDESAVATVDAALSGQYVLVPTEQIEFLQSNWDAINQPQPQPQPQPQQELYDDYDPDIDPDDPVVQQMMDLQQRVDQFEYERVEQQVEGAIQSEAFVIDQTFDYWREMHPYLSGDEVERLQNWVVQSGVFQTYSNDHDSQTATLKALDQALFMDSDLRMRALQPMIDERVQQEMQAAQEQAQRGMRASAVAGSSSGEPEGVGLSPEEAMVEEIRRSLEGL